MPSACWCWVRSRSSHLIAACAHVQVSDAERLTCDRHGLSRTQKVSACAGSVRRAASDGPGLEEDGRQSARRDHLRMSANAARVIFLAAFASIALHVRNEAATIFLAFWSSWPSSRGGLVRSAAIAAPRRVVTAAATALREVCASLFSSVVTQCAVGGVL
jgi:hypothetical protein